MSRVQISSPAPFSFQLIIIYVGWEHKLEVFSEMLVLALSLFLAAFFCYRVVLLPKATEKAIITIYEVEEILSEKR